MPESGPAARYAAVYDAIYGRDDAMLAAELDYLQLCLNHARGFILDAGCGTGRHLVPLCHRGFSVLGLDIERAMLAVTRKRLADAGLTAPLVLGDLAALPFAGGFDALLCLDSPLALLSEDGALYVALEGFRRALRPTGILVAEVFDFPGTLGTAGYGPQRTHFDTAWGYVEVMETHRPLHDKGQWEMRQDFTVVRRGEMERFAVSHRFQLRAVDDYAAALEESGFAIVELLPSYPGTPAHLRHERHMIFVAQTST